MAWRLAFRQGRSGPQPEAPVPRRSVRGSCTRRSPGTATRAIAYRVYRNGELVGQTADAGLVDYVRRNGLACRYEVAAGHLAGRRPRVARRPNSAASRCRGQGQGRLARRTCAGQHPAGIQQLASGAAVWRVNPLRVGGRAYARGLGTHARSEIVYRLDNRYQRFEAEVGVDDEKKGLGSVVFQVVADGRKLFDSGVVRGKQPARKISLPLDGRGRAATDRHRRRRRHRLRPCRLGRCAVDRKPVTRFATCPHRTARRQETPS